MPVAEEDAPLVPHVNAYSYGEVKWISLAYRKKCFNRMLLILPLISLPFSMAMPNLIEIQYDIVCRYLNIDSSVCSSSNDANRFVAKYNTFSLLLTTVPAVMMIPIVSAFVEKLGLVRGLMFVTSGYGVQLLLIYPVAYWLFPASASPYRLLLVEMMAAFTAAGALPNFFLLAVNELFPEPELRPIYVGRLTGAAAITAFLGPALGSSLTQGISMAAFFALMSACYILFSLLFITVVDLPPIITGDVHDNDSSDDESDGSNRVNIGENATFIDNLKEQMCALNIFKFSNLPSFDLRLTGVLITIWIAFFYNMDFGDLQVVILYGKQYFDWHQGSIGIMMTLMAFAQLFCVVVGFPLLQKLFMKHANVRSDSVDSLDKTFLMMAMFCNTVGLLLLSTAKTSGWFFAGLYIWGHTAISECVAKPTLLKLVSSEESSTLITALSVMERITSAVVPVTLMWIYETTLSWWPSFLFEAQFVLNVTFLIICYFLIKSFV